MAQSTLSHRSRLALPLALVLSFGFLGWLSLPAVDYDEALYAQMAREMWATGGWLQPIWDGKPFFDKPPTFIWTLLPLSGIDASTSGDTGVFRLGNIVASLLIALGCSRLVQKSIGGSNRNAGFQALYFCALFPCLGAGLLLIDLTLCAFLFLAFWVLDDCFLRAKGGLIGRSTWKQSLCLGLSIAAAAATKGLIAGIIPALATLCAALHLGSYKQPLRIVAHTVSNLWLAALLAALGTFAFYFMIWQAGHDDFVTSFFIDHHLGRGSAAMEGHSGPFLYHWLIVWIGGGWLMATLLRLLSLSIARRSTARAARETQQGAHSSAAAVFPLVWIVTTVLFFSLLATKLPNYTWPVWMALPIAVARLWSAMDERTLPPGQGKLPSKVVQGLAALGGLATTLAGLVLAGVPLGLAFPSVLEGVDPRVLDILLATPMRLSESVACSIAGILLLLSGLAMVKVSLQNDVEHLLHGAPKVALLYGTLMVVLLWGVGPFARRAYHEPLAEAARLAVHKAPELPVFTFGLKSPTFSGAYGLAKGTIPSPNITHHGDDSKSAMNPDPQGQGRLLVVPPWSKLSCSDMQARILGTIAFLKLCEQDAPVTPEG